MRIRTKKYKHLISYTCKNHCGDICYGNIRYIHHKKLNVADIEKLKGIIMDKYKVIGVVISNIQLL